MLGGEPRPRGRSPFLIGVLEGEGIGAEVVGAALKALAALEAGGRSRFEIQTGGAIGIEAEERHGTPLTSEVVDFCRDVFGRGGAILAGAGGGRFVYDLRKRFDLFCKIVPLKVCRELIPDNRLKREFIEGADIVLVRENSSGVYQGDWGTDEGTGDGRRATHSFAYSEAEVRRIVVPAARIAASRKGKLLAVIKDAGIPTVSELWRDCAAAAARTAGIECSFANIDLAAYLLIQHAQSLDVLVAPNLFGDILADLGAVILGSRALSYSGNFSADLAAVYQTNHGAAYDLAGTDRANPVGQIFSLAMLIRESFGLMEEAALIEAAVAEVWREGWRTEDLAGPGRRPAYRIVGCREMGDLVAQAIVRLSAVSERVA